MSVLGDGVEALKIESALPVVSGEMGEAGGDCADTPLPGLGSEVNAPTGIGTAPVSMSATIAVASTPAALLTFSSSHPLWIRFFAAYLKNHRVTA